MSTPKATETIQPVASTRDGRGGSRAGSGRPSKAETHATPIKDAEKQIADQLPHLIDKLLQLANGVMVQKEADGDEEGYEIYREPPNIKALFYLVNRVMGNPKERIESENQNDATLRIEVEYADPEPTE